MESGQLTGVYSHRLHGRRVPTLPARLDVVMANIRRIAQIQSRSTDRRQFELTKVAFHDLHAAIQTSGPDICARSVRERRVELDCDDLRRRERARRCHGKPAGSCAHIHHPGDSRVAQQNFADHPVDDRLRSQRDSLSPAAYGRIVAAEGITQWVASSRQVSFEVRMSIVGQGYFELRDVHSIRPSCEHSLVAMKVGQRFHRWHIVKKDHGLPHSFFACAAPSGARSAWCWKMVFNRSVGKTPARPASMTPAETIPVVYRTIVLCAMGCRKWPPRGECPATHVD